MYNNCISVGRYAVFPANIETYLEENLKELQKAEADTREALAQANKQVAQHLASLERASKVREEFEKALAILKSKETK